MGVLVAQVSFIGFGFYAFKISFRFWPFSNPAVVERDLHKESTKCKCVCKMNRGIHCKSGTSFMGLVVNAGISISNEERQKIPHSIC